MLYGIKANFGRFFGGVGSTMNSEPAKGYLNAASAIFGGLAVAGAGKNSYFTTAGLTFCSLVSSSKVRGIISGLYKKATSLLTSGREASSAVTRTADTIARIRDATTDSPVTPPITTPTPPIEERVENITNRLNSASLTLARHEGQIIQAIQTVKKRPGAAIITATTVAALAHDIFKLIAFFALLYCVVNKISSTFRQKEETPIHRDLAVD